METGATVRADLRGWLAEHAEDPEATTAVSDSTDLLGDGIVDSFLMLELLQWIEDRFGVFVDFAAGGEPLTQLGALADHVAANAVVGGAA